MPNKLQFWPGGVSNNRPVSSLVNRSMQIKDRFDLPKTLHPMQFETPLWVDRIHFEPGRRWKTWTVRLIPWRNNARLKMHAAGTLCLWPLATYPRNNINVLSATWARFLNSNAILGDAGMGIFTMSTCLRCCVCNSSWLCATLISKVRVHPGFSVSHPHLLTLSQKTENSKSPRQEHFDVCKKSSHGFCLS